MIDVPINTAVSVRTAEEMLVGISTQLSKIILNRLIIIGTVGNTLNLFLFARPALAKLSWLALTDTV
jgi:hypothetical protein